MREILFRGKRQDDGEWISGFLVYVKHIGDWVRCDTVDPSTIGQYTGLIDKNGKKIFEGDILQNEEGCLFGASYRFRVEFCKGCFYGDSCGDLTVYSPEMYLCEVIGNIHDNPELLEVRE